MYTLSLDIGATKTVLAVIGENGQITWQQKTPTLDLLTRSKNPATSLAAALRHFCDEQTIVLSSIQGIGIGFPGVMDRNSGVIASCPLLPLLDGCPLATELTAQLGIPTFTENDVNLIALGEHRYGRGRGIDNMAVVFVGSGIGCGLILNGELYVGSDGAAAEFGHTIIEPAGLLCPCGSTGCIELYCSGAALARQATALLGAQLPSQETLTSPWQLAEAVVRAARSGHPAAQEAMQQLCTYLGLGLVTLANLLNPRLILLGGGIVTGWPESIEIARTIAQTRSRIVVRDHLQVERTVLGEQAGLLGAAALVMNKKG